jgi:hypothetical protein
MVSFFNLPFKQSTTLKNYKALEDKIINSGWSTLISTLIEEDSFEYGNFEFQNGIFEKQSGEPKTKWRTKNKVGN